MNIIKTGKILCCVFLFIAFVLNAQTENGLTTSINGTIIFKNEHRLAKTTAENGQYWCDYSIRDVTDENRSLENFHMYEGSALQFSLNKVPGSDVQVTNSGFVIFYDHSRHFIGELKINIYSKYGQKVLTKTFFSADQFEFSKSGNIIGIQDNNNLSVIDLISNSLSEYEKCERFALSENYVLQLIDKKIKIYNNEMLENEIHSNLKFVRKIRISENDNALAIVSKNDFISYNLKTGEKNFSNKIKGNMTYKDIRFDKGQLFVGIHNKTKVLSEGILRNFNLDGNLINEKSGESKKIIDFESQSFIKKTNSVYDVIPWPFFPFDSMRTVWNHYEQHMGYGTGDWSYLHQGLDLIIPIEEKTYSVRAGVVKSMLTLGGDVYWRIAIGDSLEEGFSDGWLYAHLIETTIQFDVGDTVQLHDYLGDIVAWTEDWGHIHFVQIRDSGLTWYYDDNQWGINFNPLLALSPMQDTITPQFDYVDNLYKFGFCENETSNYLSGDSLYGEIDIFIKVVDYIGESDWQQPAYKTYFWIVNEITGDTLQGKTLGHILNHSYPFYGSSNYTPYAEVMYKRNDDYPTSSWMDKERNYYHILTNSNGDNLLTLDERELGFNTALYPDGSYRIYAQIYDVAGNSNLDSITVQFINGNVTDVKSAEERYSYSLAQNYPNPFNPETIISYSISQTGFVQLKLYDILGRELQTLVSDLKYAGNYEVLLNGNNLSSGVYYYTLKTKDFTKTRKMVYLK